MAAQQQQPGPAALVAVGPTHATVVTSASASGSGALQRLGRDIFAGTCGGISVTLVGHPLDTIKVRLQTQPVGAPIYSGVLDCARKTVQWEGFGGLYKGVASPLAGQMFFRASLFGTFGSSKRWLATRPDGGARELAAADFYKAGAMTGFVAAFTEGPIDFYKSQIQVQIIRSKSTPGYVPPYTTVGACVRATLKENGLRGPFQGLGATILRNMPANAIFFGTFEVLKRAAAGRMGVTPSELPAWTVLSAAGFGGVLYWGMIFPVDSIKSAMQTDTIVRCQRRFTDVATTARLLWAEGGARRFYKGFTPCLLRAGPANAAMLFTVDRVTAALSKA
ncbi:MAG: mitochondrial carrier domain-containing protein [Monoraphidium minutum]|nr:MAG: mitochondrial carrier domain-containing protein [Monoraphidium minutum]